MSSIAPTRLESPESEIADIGWLAQSLERVGVENGWQQGEWQTMAHMLETLVTCGNPAFQHAPFALYALSVCRDNLCM
jgi:hypothetical protein